MQTISQSYGPLFDFCTQLENNALGSLREFKKRVAKTIERSNEQDASNHERLFGGAMEQAVASRDSAILFEKRKRKTRSYRAKRQSSSAGYRCPTRREEYRNVLTTPRQKSDGLVTSLSSKKFAIRDPAKLDFWRAPRGNAHCPSHQEKKKYFSSASPERC